VEQQTAIKGEETTAKSCSGSKEATTAAATGEEVRNLNMGSMGKIENLKALAGKELEELNGSKEPIKEAMERKTPMDSIGSDDPETSKETDLESMEESEDPMESMASTEKSISMEDLQDSKDSTDLME
jgi:hypothetical protein